MINKKSIAITIVGIGACAFTLAKASSGANPVTKALKVQATASWVVDLSDGSAVAYDTGEATHAGRYTNEGSGTWDLSTFDIVSASGTVTTANGGQILGDSPGSS